MTKWSEVIKNNENVVVEKVIERMQSSEAHWTSKTILRMYEEDELNFDNALQRALVWDDERKSLLIHSLITNFPVDPIKAIKNGKKYDILDGKQRVLGTVIMFMQGKFKLVNIPDVIVVVNGEPDEVDLNDLTYDQLPEVVRDLIDEFTFLIKIMDENTSEEMVNEAFFRCNNYKPMSAIDLTRAKAKSQKTIKRIASNKLFTENLTANMLSKYVNEDIVIKSYIMLHEKDPSLATKDVRKYITDIEITEEEEKCLNDIYDRIYEMFDVMMSKKFDYIEKASDRKKAEKFQAKIAKRIVTRTHTISIVPIIRRSITEGITVEEMVNWFETFFSGKQKASISALYNEAAGGSGTGKKEAVRKRNNELNRNFDKWLKKLNTEKVKAAAAESNEVFEETIVPAEDNSNPDVKIVNETPEVHQMTIDEVTAAETATDEVASPAA